MMHSASRRTDKYADRLKTAWQRKDVLLDINHLWLYRVTGAGIAFTNCSTFQSLNLDYVSQCVRFASTMGQNSPSQKHNDADAAVALSSPRHPQSVSPHGPLRVK